jgi:hypothetical protein
LPALLPNVDDDADDEAEHDEDEEESPVPFSVLIIGPLLLSVCGSPGPEPEPFVREAFLVFSLNDAVSDVAASELSLLSLFVPTSEEESLKLEFEYEDEEPEEL